MRDHLRPLLLVAVAACGKGDAPSAAAAGSDCQRYAQKTADLMAIGFERGAKQAKYVRPELIARLLPPFAALCAKLPVEHARCVARAATAADADACQSSLSAAQNTEVITTLGATVKAVIKDVTEVPATAAECAQLSTTAAKEMAEAVGVLAEKMPSAAAVAKLCTDDHWTADFVRCKNDHGVDCRANPNVKAGVTRLIQAGVGKP